MSLNRVNSGNPFPAVHRKTDIRVHDRPHADYCENETTKWCWPVEEIFTYNPHSLLIEISKNLNLLEDLPE